MGTKLFVGGLPWATDDSGLREAFERFGNLVDARVIYDRESGRSRGFGFVTYASDGEAEAARSAMDGGQIEGRHITVRQAEERPPRAGPGGSRPPPRSGPGGRPDTVTRPRPVGRPGMDRNEGRPPPRRDDRGGPGGSPDRGGPRRDEGDWRGPRGFAPPPPVEMDDWSEDKPRRNRREKAPDNGAAEEEPTGGGRKKSKRRRFDDDFEDW